MLKAISLALLAATIISLPVQARDLRVAPAGPPAHPAHYMYEKFAGYLSEVSGGSMSATILGPEVVAVPQMKDALQSGLVEVGNFLPLFFPADMPTTTLAGDLALLGRNPHAMTLAFSEYVVTCAPCQQEFKKLGLVFLGAGGSDVYGLLTTKPVRTADDLKGLRLRSGGAPYSRFAEHFGAVPVSLGVGDQFEAMSQGTIDGTMASVVDLLSFRLIDVAKYVTTVPIGTYHVTSNFTIGATAWQSFSPQEREFVVAAAARANPDLTDRWAYQLPAAAMDAVSKSTIEVITPDAALLEATQAFAGQDEEARVAQGGAEAAKFRDLVVKWTAIVEEVGTDPKTLADRATAEIWSKVDWSTYGM